MPTQTVPSPVPTQPAAILVRCTHCLHTMTRWPDRCERCRSGLLQVLEHPNLHRPIAVLAEAVA